MLAIAIAVVVSLTPLSFQSAPTFQTEINRVEQLERQGGRLNATQAAAFEQALAQSPGDLDARAQLLGFYFSPASQSLGTAVQIEARRRHTLWLINNHPESLLLMTGAATLDASGHPLADAPGYEQARTAWLAQTAKKDASAAVLGNAGRFFLLPDKKLAITLFSRARALEPANPLWTAQEASAMVFAVIGINGQNQNGMPAPADPAAASSAEAKAIRRDLENSNDVSLLTAAGIELAARGHIAQNLARLNYPNPEVLALDLAETLLKKAERLDPTAHDANLTLARVYYLRAITAPAPEDKKKFQDARYRELVKGTEGITPDTPANANQLLELGRAAIDAHDDERAVAIARSLLASKSADEYTADMVTHYANLILGTAALRKNDIGGTKTYLLAAAGVKSGRGTLSSFGPNMALAKALLEKDEKAAVIQYLELCRKFWASGNAQLDAWTADINQGRIPNFGPNLTY